MKSDESRSEYQIPIGDGVPVALLTFHLKQRLQIPDVCLILFHGLLSQRNEAGADGRRGEKSWPRKLTIDFRALTAWGGENYPCDSSTVKVALVV